ncbi:MAG: transposase [Verrucomicrobia bacterium]|nr:transposase [Verrucomicrobiota bacterium]
MRPFGKIHPAGQPPLFLYDVTSSYLEGQYNAFGCFGYNRDGKRGKQQIVIGLLCDGEGVPLAIEVFAGNPLDPQTMTSQIQKVATRCDGGAVTFVGDRGMIKGPQIAEPVTQGFHHITAITKPQIESLLKTGV